MTLQRNNGGPVSEARTPRALIKLNDTVIRKIETIDYVENNYYQPDSFRVDLPLYNLTDNGEINIEYWLSQGAVMVEILMGFPKDPVNYGVSDLQSMVIGGINDVSIRVFDNGGGFVSFNGFDLSKKFADNKIVEKYPQHTASQIATALAIKRGLTPVVTPTKTLVGVYYAQQFVQLGNETTEWDLLTYLAQREGFQVFVRGTSLYFKPRTTETPDPYKIPVTTAENGKISSMNGSRLVLYKNYNYARDVTVNVRSWSIGVGRVQVQAKGQKTKKPLVGARAQTIGETQTFDYFIPGLSKQQATERAQALLQDISAHERLLEIDKPGDNILRKDSLIQITGLSPSADQTYFPDTITRRMHCGTGEYSMNIRAKNHSPQSTVII
jgi:phage protein D